MKKYLIPTICFFALILWFSYPFTARADITTSLVDWYKFDENTGTSAGDSGSNNITGTLSGTIVPTWTTGKVNSGVSIATVTASNSRVALASSITLTGAFTVAMWWNGTTHASVMMALGANNNSQKFGVVTANTFFVRILNGGSSDSTVSTPTTGTYHFVVLKRDASNIVYLSVDNGADSTLFGGVAQSGNFVIDAIGNSGNTSPTQDFDGSLDEVRVYSRLLSASDQTELFNYTGGGVTTPNGAKMLLSMGF